MLLPYSENSHENSSWKKPHQTKTRRQHSTKEKSNQHCCNVGCPQSLVLCHLVTHPWRMKELLMATPKKRLRMVNPDWAFKLLFNRLRTVRWHVRLFSLSVMIFIVSEHEPQAMQEHRSDWNLCSHIIRLVLEKEVSHNPKRWWWQITLNI